MAEREGGRVYLTFVLLCQQRQKDGSLHGAPNHSGVCDERIGRLQVVVFVASRVMSHIEYGYVTFWPCIFFVVHSNNADKL